MIFFCVLKKEVLLVWHDTGEWLILIFGISWSVAYKWMKIRWQFFLWWSLFYLVLYQHKIQAWDIFFLYDRKPQLRSLLSPFNLTSVFFRASEDILTSLQSKSTIVIWNDAPLTTSKSNHPNYAHSLYASIVFISLQCKEEMQRLPEVWERNL